MELYPIGWVGFIGIPGCSAMITGNFAVDISNANRCGDRVKIIGNFGKSRAPHHEMDPELTAKAMAYLDETYAACGRGFFDFKYNFITRKKTKETLPAIV